MPAVRSRTLGIKVTEEEYEQLEAEAVARGQTMSDWGREVLLNQIGEPSGHNVVLAEVMALRSIVTNVMSALAQGESMTRERMGELVRYADTERFRRANEKWVEAANHYMDQNPKQVKSKNNGQPKE